MSVLYDGEIYINSLRKIKNIEFFENKTILVSGVSGMIGSCFVDTLLINKNLKCKIIGLVRNLENAKERFEYWKNDKRLQLLKCDITNNVDFKSIREILSNNKIDYIIHLASNTHPVLYSTKPISTITTNVIGTNNLLEFANETHCDKFLFASSVEVYGKALNFNDDFSEEYCGYIDSNTLRAGYPESKRVGEALCQAYIKEKNMNIVIARFPRIFGPTMLISDSKASSQFIKNGLNGEDIVLKSEGKQYFSYCYVNDIISSIITLLEKGENGEVYNVADNKCNVTLKEFAQTVAQYSNTNVIFDLPKEDERKGFSTADRAIMISDKINKLGWYSNWSFGEAIKETLEIMRK